MNQVLLDTVRTLRRLAMRQMEPSELAEWLAVHLPDLWDSGTEADRYILSELSLALDRMEREARVPEFLAEKAFALAAEMGIELLGAFPASP